jgi:DNA mismatch repair protein MutS2
LRCDLRGHRVDEAVDRLSAAVDQATADGRDGLLVIHGHGTGALREAVRNHLRGSPYVGKVRPGADDEGGEGVTLAELG